MLEHAAMILNFKTTMQGVTHLKDFVISPIATVDLRGAVEYCASLCKHRQCMRVV
jgi:hypothetical protein